MKSVASCSNNYRETHRYERTNERKSSFESIRLRSSRANREFPCVLIEPPLCELPLRVCAPLPQQTNTEGSSVAFSRLIPWQLSLLELCRWFQSEGRTGSNRLLKELSANKLAAAAWLREWNFVYLPPRLLWKNSA